MAKQYGNEVMSTFDPCYQDLAKNIIQNGDIPKMKEEKSFNDYLDELDEDQFKIPKQLDRLLSKRT